MLAVLLVGAAAGGTLWWLLADLAHQSAGQPVPGAGSARGEILRTALAAGAGVGAAITLALAFRRQNHQELHSFITARHAERVAAATEHDAAERRVTDLYTKAAEQLGHDRAAVRLAGLYALERLAQDNPLHRQTIVNVICAYLRMPYAAPESASARENERRAALLAARRRYRAARLGALAVPDHAPRQETDREGELQVRLTAQRVLAEHLRDDRPLSTWDESPPSPRYWEGMRLDLTGATLIDFELTRARFTGSFDGVTFSGRAGFDFVTFSGDAGFDRVTFTGGCRFRSGDLLRGRQVRRGDVLPGRHGRRSDLLHDLAERRSLLRGHIHRCEGHAYARPRVAGRVASGSGPRRHRLSDRRQRGWRTEREYLIADNTEPARRRDRGRPGQHGGGHRRCDLSLNTPAAPASTPLQDAP